MTTAESQTVIKATSLKTVVWWLLFFAVMYTICMVRSWNLGHLDFGDGNYMYISWRVANGALLYEDILAPQPPVHFVIGVLLSKMGVWFSHPLYAFRLFSLLLHLVTMLLVYCCTVNVACGDDRSKKSEWRMAGVWAGLLYMLFPIGFWWTAGYQSEPTEMAFMLGAFWLTMKFTSKSSIGAGVLMGLAMLTNMTAAPFALFIAVGLLIRQPRLSAYYIAGFLPVMICVLGGAELWTGACIENVFLNQVGSYPRPELLPAGTSVFDYFQRKLISEGMDILSLDGGFILLSLLGLLAYSIKGCASVRIREFVVLFVFCTLLSFIYVTKGGTVDYIFTIGEPFAAIMGGWFIYWFWQSIRGSFRINVGNFTAVGWWGSVLLLILCVCYPGMRHCKSTLEQTNYEADEYRTLQVVREIQAATPEDGVILAPPHYAFVAKRKIALDYSELLLWTLKYLNEKVDKEDGRAMQTVRRLAEMITNREISFIALDMNQTAKIPEIQSAIDANYRKVRETPFKTLNTSLQFYVPNSDHQK